MVERDLAKVDVARSNRVARFLVTRAFQAWVSLVLVIAAADGISSSI